MILWGERSVNPITSFRTCNVHDTIGDDICMLAVGSRTPRTRHYTARASTVTELATLDGNAFAELMDSGRFATFHRHVKAYGVWQILRNVVIKHVRECAAARSESRRVKHHSNFGVDKRGASAFDVDRSADLAADLIRKLATFLAAPKRERAQALKESAGGRARQESEVPNFKGSFLGRFPLVSADFWTSDHLSKSSRSVGAVLKRARAEHSR